jgi:predicted ATPase/DNA-binding XRE family transcriptional regulator
MALERSRSFANLLREYRRAAEMTQEELAERAGISVRALRKLESGASLAPRRDTIDLLATALQLATEKRTLLESTSRHSIVAASTTALLGTVSPPPLNPAAVPLVGRSRELARLEKHLAGVGPPLLVLAGEPGIGKSRLLQEVALLAHEQGRTVLQGGCHRRSSQEPYAPLLAALASSVHHQTSAQLRRHLQGCAWLVRLLPELAESSLVPAPSWSLQPAQERRLMFAAVARYLMNIASPSGTLLVLDDLHWAGQDALDLLAALLRVPASVSQGQGNSHERKGTDLRVVVAYRSTEVRTADPMGVLLADLIREDLATTVELGPLMLPAADELANALLTDLPRGDKQELQRQLVERAGGVPYFLVSCAQALQDEVYDTGDRKEPQGSGERGGRGDETEKTQLPGTVAQSIRQRLALLPEAARELVNVIAVSGRELAVPVLLAVASQTGLQPAETLGALEVAVQAGLLVEEERNRYAFTHDLIREVAVMDVGVARRATLHGWVGKAILQSTLPAHEPEAAAILYQLGERLYAEQVEKALGKVSRLQWRRNSVTADDTHGPELSRRE